MTALTVVAAVDQEGLAIGHDDEGPRLHVDVVDAQGLRRPTRCPDCDQNEGQEQSLHGLRGRVHTSART